MVAIQAQDETATPPVVTEDTILEEIMALAERNVELGTSYEASLDRVIRRIQENPDNTLSETEIEDAYSEAYSNALAASQPTFQERFAASNHTEWMVICNRRITDSCCSK